MKQFIDFIPLILFFIIFKINPTHYDIMGFQIEIGGIFSATLFLILSSIIVYGVFLIKYKRLETSQWITLIGCFIFGGMTLIFHSETFLKWKAPIINWIFALGFIMSHYIGKQVLIQRLIGQALKLPNKVWFNLNIAWSFFFIFSGAIQLFVAFNFDSIWVDFKVFGSLIMTVLFIIAQSLYLAPYLKNHQKNNNEH